MDDIASALPEELRPKFLGLVNQLVSLTRQCEHHKALAEREYRTNIYLIQRNEALASSIADARQRKGAAKLTARRALEENNTLRAQLDRYIGTFGELDG